MNFSVFEKKFSQFAHKHLFVGFSGGADSTALLLLAHHFRAAGGYNLTAIHFNHHLRAAESEREAAAAMQFAAGLNVEIRIIDLHFLSRENLESRAREARLFCFRQIAAAEPEAVFLLGHHADDLIETAVMRLLRGGGAGSIANLTEEKKVGPLRIVRPLLDFTKQEITDFLRTNGITGWAEDSSNRSEDFQRNRLRNRLLPELFQAFPDSKTGLLKSLEYLRREAAYLEEAADKALAAGQPECREFWCGTAPALRHTMLKKYLQQLFAENIRVTPAVTETFFRLAAGTGTGQLPFGRRQTLIFSGKYLFPQRERAAGICWDWHEQPEISAGEWYFRREYLNELPAKITVDPAIAYFDADALPEKLLLTLPEAGETMRPFGRMVPVKLKKLRVDRKIPALPPRPVVKTADGTIIWAPEIRNSAEFPAGPGRIVKLTAARRTEK